MSVNVNMYDCAAVHFEYLLPSAGGDQPKLLKMPKLFPTDTLLLSVYISV